MIKAKVHGARKAIDRMARIIKTKIMCSAYTFDILIISYQSLSPWFIYIAPCGKDILFWIRLLLVRQVGPTMREKNWR